ncbi:zinc-ribbon domain-containing protein, partial [Streptomyces scabiei]
MKAYSCRVCANVLYFENSVCVACGTPLGYARHERDIVPVDVSGVYVDA